MKSLLNIFILLISITVLNSCKQKGCMDPNSLTYDITAEEDDGSCLYCDSVITHIADRTQNLSDSYFGSPHYGQQVMKFDFTQHADTFNFMQCGTSACFTSLKVTSLVNQSMQIYFNVYFSSPFFVNYYKSMIIKPGETVDLGDIGQQTLNNCISISSATISIVLQQQITYF